MRPVSLEDGRQPFVADVQELRRRTKDHMDMGAMTRGYRSERETVIRILNEVLATELVCMRRYKRHYFVAAGIDAQEAAVEFLERSDQEQEHVEMVAERILNLGGMPNFKPERLATRMHEQYAESTALPDMVREDLIAEQIAMESYREIIGYLGDNDPTSRIAMEQMMAQKEERTRDLTKLLEALTTDERFQQQFPAVAEEAHPNTAP